MENNLYTALRPLRWYKILGTFPINNKINKDKLSFVKVRLIGTYLFIFLYLTILTATMSYVLITGPEDFVIVCVKIFKMLVTYRCIIKTFIRRDMLAEFFNWIIRIDDKVNNLGVRINYR